MRVLKIYSALLLVLTAFQLHSQAQTCTCSACTGGVCTFNAGGSGALSLAQGKWIAEASTEYEALSNNGFTIYDDATARLNNILDHAVVASGALYYGVSDNFQVSVHQPVVWLKMDFDQQAMSSFGDATVLGSYSFGMNESQTLKASVSAGCEMPTGSKASMNDYAISVSSGSWDPIAAATVSYSMNRWSVIAGAMYKITTRGFNDVYFGNLFTHDIKVQYNLFANESKNDSVVKKRSQSALQLQLGMRGEQLQPQRLSNKELVNTGSTILYTQAGINWQVTKCLSIPFTVSLPVYSDITGFQNVPTSRVHVAIQYLF